MTGPEMERARKHLGLGWGFGRPLMRAELARALDLRGDRAWQAIRDYERGKSKISGPIAQLITLWLAGARPTLPLDEIRQR